MANKPIVTTDNSGLTVLQQVSIDATPPRRERYETAPIISRMQTGVRPGVRPAAFDIRLCKTFGAK